MRNHKTIFELKPERESKSEFDVSDREEMNKSGDDQYIKLRPIDPFQEVCTGRRSRTEPIAGLDFRTNYILNSTLPAGD